MNYSIINGYVGENKLINPQNKQMQSDAAKLRRWCERYDEKYTFQYLEDDIFYYHLPIDYV